MTVVALVAGAVLTAASTRLAAAAFVGGAVWAAIEPEGTAVGTWLAVTAAGIVLLYDGPLRSLALPALGTAAVVGAISGRNVAVVAGMWALASAAAALSAAFSSGSSSGTRRWGALLALGDLVVLVVLAVSARGGFEGWPGTLEPWAAVALLAAAALRMPLAAGPPAVDGAPLGLLVVRAQAAALVALAAPAGGEWVATTALCGGAVLFAAASLAERSRTLDVAQETALLAMVTGASGLGSTGSVDLVWTVLAGGTLIHHLRLMVGPVPAGRWASALLASAGIGLPFLPAVAGLLEGAATDRGWRATFVVVGLIAGIAGRVRSEGRRSPSGGRRRQKVATPVLAVRGWATVAVVSVASLWAPVLTSPDDLLDGGRSLSGGASSIVAWPPPWAVLLLLVAGAALPMAGRGLLPRKPPAGSSSAELSGPLPGWVAALGRLPSGPAMLHHRWAVPGILGVQLLVATGSWIWGLSRGFL